MDENNVISGRIRAGLCADDDGMIDFNKFLTLIDYRTGSNLEPEVTKEKPEVIETINTARNNYSTYSNVHDGHINRIPTKVSHYYNDVIIL